MKGGEINFSILFQDQTLRVQLPDHTTLAELQELLQRNLPKLDGKTMKLLARGKTIRLHDHPTATLYSAGITHGSRLKLLASTKTAVQAVQQAHEPSAMSTFEHEEERAKARQASRSPQGPPSYLKLPLEDQRFGKFEIWNVPGLNPPPSEALGLLHSLAAEPGIVALMKKRNWKVNILSEMAPEGLVGVDDVCELGLNYNNGQKIALRLRTDDLKGFRKYHVLVETLLHELAHNEFSGHGNGFRTLHSQLIKEYKAMDWRRSMSGRTTSGVATAEMAPTLQGGGGRLAEDGSSSGNVGPRKLGGGGSPPMDARTAAAHAALRRTGASSAPSSFPVTLTPPPSPPAQTPASEGPPKKGDAVLYKQRDGQWVPAKVINVDLSVQPPSYGIELPGSHGEEPHYRETELPRLRALPAPGSGE